MPNQSHKIVVITPVKNESWILERFLAVTSQFADHIIIADQNSTDDSPNICRKYENVTFIQNNSNDYSEAERQTLLIEKARKLVPEQKILLALDADEIIAANATKTVGWQSMLKAKPGTVLCFEKPDLYLTPYQRIRYDTPWPIGYVDDGAEHTPKNIHSIRIPMPDYACKLYIHDVKVLHYGLTRLDAQKSKARMYSVLENILCARFNPKYLLQRRRVYSANQDLSVRGSLEKSPMEWFTDWEKIGIDMFTIALQKYYWYDFEVLKYFEKYGCLRFWLDDIWEFDWESCRIYATLHKKIPDFRILFPPKLIEFPLRLVDRLYLRLLNIK